MSLSWSINPGGTWSPRQAQAVMAIIRPEAEAQGLEMYPLDITVFGGPERVLICTRPVGRVVKHDGDIVMRVTFDTDELNAVITQAQLVLAELRYVRSRTWWRRLVGDTK